MLFFLADGEVHGLRMNLEGQVLINELADYQPCTVLQWRDSRLWPILSSWSGWCGDLAELD